MHPMIKDYINKLFGYIPVAVFFFTIVFYINMMFALDGLQKEFGTNTLDVILEFYQFFFIRTLILALLIPLFDPILKLVKFSYRVRTIIHGIVINITVGILYYRPGNNAVSLLIIIAMCTVIYITVWLILLLREKQFISNANKIFEQNK